jgi:hydroxyacylglutathione hydrolase
MILKRFYDEKLAQASYLIGCAKTGEAAVIDAFRDINVYLAAAQAEGLRITAVTETHIHADYVSGSRELGHVTGATLYLSDEGPADWKYAFAHEPNVKLVRHGDQIRIGNVRLDVYATPGHTPEHITFVLTDEPASPEPQAAFTGDFIFVGDVGRPDLLERAAGFEGTMEAGAKVLFGSLQKFLRDMPDHLMLWPAHGSGSACGKSLGGVPVSTLGYERQTNWGLKFSDPNAFAEAVLAGQPEPPFYFKEMKRINKVGPALLDGFRMPARLGGNLIMDRLNAGFMVVDLRSADAYAAEHIPGTLNLPMGKGFTNWAGWFLPYNAPVYLLAETEAQVEQAVRDLQKIGLDDVAGWFGPDALRAGIARADIPQMDLAETLTEMEAGRLTLIDVRGANEFAEGHIPGAIHIPLGHLPRRLGDIPTDRPVAVVCESGGRSPMAASVLRRLGVSQVANVPAGTAGYRTMVATRPDFATL